LAPHHNEAAVAVVLAPVMLAANGVIIPTVDRMDGLVGRVVISTHRMAVSS